MVFKFTERRKSRATTDNPASTVLQYVAAGENDPGTVYAYAIGATPAIVASVTEILYRSNISIEPVGYQIFNVDVSYAPKNVDSKSIPKGEWQLSFDTTGGTVHIQASKETIAAYGIDVNKNDHGGLIGVHGPNEEPGGADITIPVLKLTATFSHNFGIVTPAHIKNLARWTGKVNSDTFMGFAPGEILFMGATGREGADAPTQVDYHFAAQENLTGLSVGSITVTEKKGHDLYWIGYKPDIDIAGKRGVMKPYGVWVERVYDRIPMAAAFGFGS